MSVYFVTQYNVTDPEGYARYAELVPPITGASQAKVLAMGGAQVLEGEPGARTVMLEFPDQAAFDDWYHSDAYQEIVHHRTDNSEGWAILIEGR